MKEIETAVRQFSNSYSSEINLERERVEFEILKPASLENRRVLVVGGAGYIGTVVTQHLLAKGYIVRSVDLLMYENQVALLPFLGNPSFEFLFGDMSDRDFMASALTDVTDVVILAGLVGDPITKKYPEASEKINGQGVIGLLHEMLGRRMNKVIFVSTCSNYGLIKDNEVADEQFELNPLSLYAKSKVAAEKCLLNMAGSVDFHGTVLRFATAFGLSPRMRFDLTISEFTRRMYQGDDLLVYDADTWRPYCHVKDFCDVIECVLEAPAERVSFEVFNAGGEANNYTKQMIVDAILEMLPDAPVRYQAHGADPRNYRVDFRKIRERLYFEPTYSVRDGVAELIAALRQNIFSCVEERPNFFGNHHIDYPQQNKAL